MRAIIDGLRYDTKTATEVAGYDNGLGWGDFRHIEEALFRTPRGRWFLAGCGGAMTRYARSCGGNCTTGGEGIHPIAAADARKWLEARHMTEALEEHFADAIEDA